MSDSLFPLLLTLRYMHILGAIALMGGTIFMRFALLPTVTQLDPTTKATIHQEVRSRWSKFVMLAAGLLLISGIVNLGLAARYEYERVFGMSYHMVVGIKFILALPIFFVASVLAGRSEMAKKFQASAKTWMNFNLTLALLMVLIGGALKFVKREPKAEKPQNAAVSAEFTQIASKMLPFQSDAE
jgi:uncharacterized membrane protein